MTVLLTSSVALPRSASRLHFPKLLTLGHPIIHPPFDGSSFYLPEHVEQETTVDDTKVADYLKQHRYYHPSKNYNINELKDYFTYVRSKETSMWIDTFCIPNIFTVKTRKFSTLVNFNASGLGNNPATPAFVVFQENLEIMETVDYSFMLYSEPSLPKKPAYEGFKYVASHDKVSLFVKAQVIEQ